MMQDHLTNETLLDYLHRELSPGDDAQVLVHLEQCERCARELNVEAAIGDRLRATARSEELELPLGMRSAILARIAALAPAPVNALRSWLRPVVIVPVAASLAAGAILLGPVHSLQTAPSSAALPVSYYLEEHAARSQENPLADHGTILLSSLEGPAAAVPTVEAVESSR
jgi:anti-sigma factor RsiW